LLIRHPRLLLVSCFKRLPKVVRVALARLGGELREMLDLQEKWDISRREMLAALFLRGEGIEIGALDFPLQIPADARAKYVDRMSMEELKATFPYLETVKGPDIVDDGEKLSKIPNSSQDFVIANHFIEHCQDPIGTIKTFLRVLRPGGLLYMAVPDKRFTFDVDRPSTTFEHLLRDHTEGPSWSRLDHFREAITVYGGATDPAEIERCVDFEMNKVGHTHFHVWSQEDMFTFVGALKTRAELDIEVEAFVTNHDRGEGIFIIRKGEAGRDREMAEESLIQVRQTFRERFNAANHRP
jgi:SAM-dependent methyltransferase